MLSLLYGKSSKTVGSRDIPEFVNKVARLDLNDLNDLKIRFPKNLTFGFI